MALQARQLEDWELDGVDCTEQYRTVEEPVMDSAGNPVLVDADDGDGGTVQIPKKITRYERRKHYAVKRSRKAIGVTLFREDTGQSSNAFAMYTGPDTAIAYVSWGRAWRCTRDALDKDQHEIGAALNEQTWEFYSRWEKISMNQFGG